MPFEVVVLGVGDTFSERHHTFGLLLSCDGFRLAIDLPDVYRRVLADAAARAARPLALTDIDHVLVTHVHGDHVNGLEGVAFFKHFAQGRPLQLITSDEVRSVLWEQRLVASMSQLWDGNAFRRLSFEDYFAWTPLRWDRAVTVGPFQIRARLTRHHVPTSALLVEAAGRTLGISSDTAFDPALLSFLEPADLIIHETNYGPAHTPYASLAALPPEARTKLRLIHYPDELLAVDTVIPLLREGEVLTV